MCIALPSEPGAEVTLFDNDEGQETMRVVDSPVAHLAVMLMPNA
jgi:hypothetical protein